MVENKNSVKEQLKSAFLRQLYKKKYLDITVTDLINEAQVARVSYYRVYNSYSEILDDIALDMQKKINQNILPIYLNKPETAWSIIITTIFKEFSDGNFLKMPPDNVSFLLSYFSKKQTIITGDNVSLQERYIFAANVGIIFSIASTWITLGCPNSIEEISEFTLNIIKKNFSDTNEITKRIT